MHISHMPDADATPKSGSMIGGDWPAPKDRGSLLRKSTKDEDKQYCYSYRHPSPNGIYQCDGRDPQVSAQASPQPTGASMASTLYDYQDDICPLADT